MKKGKGAKGGGMPAKGKGPKMKIKKGK